MLVLADAVLTGWYIGFSIALVVVVLVVVLVGIILGLARRIGVQAQMITEGLDDARVNTLTLWGVNGLNRDLRQIIRDAEQARAALGGRK